MSTKDPRIRTPEENYESASFELAIYRMMKRDHDMVKVRMSEENENELLRAAENSMPRMLSFIDKQMGHIIKHTHLWNQSFRILKIAAVVVLILNMGLTIAALASSNVCARVIEFLTEINDSYMRTGFSETGEEALVPEDWPESYYPVYIPEGYSMQQYTLREGVSIAEYSDAEGNILLIKVCDASTFGRLNTEKAEITYVDLHSVTAIVLKQP